MYIKDFPSENICVYFKICEKNILNNIIISMETHIINKLFGIPVISGQVNSVQVISGNF